MATRILTRHFARARPHPAPLQVRADDDTPALAAAPAKEETFALPAAPAKPAKETKPGECSSGPRPAPPRDYDHCEDILLDDIFEIINKICKTLERFVAQQRRRRLPG